MKIKIKEKEHIDILTKISIILLGIFSTSLTYAISLKNIQIAGIYLGTIIIAIIATLGFKYSKRKSQLRLFTWSITISTIISIIICLALLFAIKNSLKGF